MVVSGIRKRTVMPIELPFSYSEDQFQKEYLCVIIVIILLV